jgi:hypothetical protein
MGNIFNQDFIDFLEAFNHANVEYMLVGGYAVNLHGYRRSTGDMDVWVNSTIENLKKIRIAFSEFGLPQHAINENQFLTSSKNEYDVFTFGISPVAIDVLTKCKGLKFSEAYSRSEIMHVDNIDIRIVHKKDLITAKKSVGRNRDIDDIEHLTD